MIRRATLEAALFEAMRLAALLDWQGMSEVRKRN